MSSDVRGCDEVDVEFEEKRHGNSFDFVDMNDGMFLSFMSDLAIWPRFFEFMQVYALGLSFTP